MITTTTPDFAVTKVSEKANLRLPRWCTILLLLGFPLLYQLNGFAPWTRHLFAQREHSWWVGWFCSVLILHWLSIATLLLFLRRARWPLAIIGLTTPPAKLLTTFALLAATGFALVWVKTAVLDIHVIIPHTAFSMVYPLTLGQRCFWIFIALSGAFCEELLYRGFAITELRRNGINRWLAAALASVSFVLIHGSTAFHSFPNLFIAGMISSGIFLWRRSLLPGMIFHALVDLCAVFVF